MTGQRKSAVEKIDVGYVARLARLPLTDEEVRLFQPQLDEIVGYVRQLTQLDLSGIEPTSHPVRVTNVLRPDRPRSGLDAGVVLANAPEQIRGHFKVPKIVE